jgi:hypothetical protein
MSLEPQISKTTSASPNQPQHKTMLVRKALFLLIVFILGFGGGYITGRQSMPMTESHPDDKSMVNVDEIYPPAGYTISASFGDLGPKLVEAGVIDLPRFMELYKQAGSPLTDEQLAILTKGSNSPIVINQENDNFLLSFFWAFGLTNQNPILTEGPMISRGKEQTGNYASTGGWTIGAKSPMELYASTAIVHLTEEQQARLLKVAAAIYRPCCDNPTHFPDCNHGMAMLGLLELMASQNANEADMFNAAKYINAYWFPQQTLEIATLLKATENVDFAQAKASDIVSAQYSSGSGFRNVHQWLAENGLLEQAPNQGDSCGVQ